MPVWQSTEGFLFAASCNTPVDIYLAAAKPDPNLPGSALYDLDAYNRPKPADGYTGLRVVWDYMKNSDEIFQVTSTKPSEGTQPATNPRLISTGSTGVARVRILGKKKGAGVVEFYFEGFPEQTIQLSVRVIDNPASKPTLQP